MLKTSIATVAYLLWVSVAMVPLVSHAQGQRVPTPEEYVAHVGPAAKLVLPGKLRIDDRLMSCDRYPTVLDPMLDDHSGAYAGFLIVNPSKIARLTSAQKRWVFGVACGYQFMGPDPEAADCYAVQMGHREGWLDAAGLEEVCRFITPAKARPAERIAPGPDRCAKMRRCLAIG
jgi:hypothetical protein